MGLLKPLSQAHEHRKRPAIEDAPGAHLRKRRRINESSLRLNLDEPYPFFLEPDLGEEDYGEDEALLRKVTNASIVKHVLIFPKPKRRQKLDPLIWENTKSKPEDEASKKSPKRRILDEDNLTWECRGCGAFNANDESACVQCKASRSEKPVSSNWGNVFAKFQIGWKCEVCSSQNGNESSNECICCQNPRSGAATSAPPTDDIASTMGAPQSTGPTAPLFGTQLQTFHVSSAKDSIFTDSRKTNPFSNIGGVKFFQKRNSCGTNPQIPLADSQNAKPSTIFAFPSSFSWDWM